MKEVFMVIGVIALVVAAGGAGYMICKKSKKEEDPQIPAAVARKAAPRSSRQGAYECYDFMNQCTEGDVGGCKQYEDTCRSAQAVRSSGANTAKGIQECAAFRDNCARGDYTSCNLYTRGCMHEGTN